MAGGGPERGHEVPYKAESHVGVGTAGAVDLKHELERRVTGRIGVHRGPLAQRFEIFVDVLRDGVEEELAGASRIQDEEILEHLDGSVTAPLLDADAAADRLRDLVALLVGIHFEREAERRAAPGEPHEMRL